MAKRSPRPVAEILGRVIRSQGLEQGLNDYCVDPVWKRAVGDAVAAQAWPVRLQGGTLLVEVRSASWMNELSLLREKIRKAVNRELRRAAVKDLRFRRGPALPRLPDETPIPVTPVTLAAEDLARAEDELRGAGAGEGAQMAARARALQRRRRDR